MSPKVGSKPCVDVRPASFRRCSFKPYCLVTRDDKIHSLVHITYTTGELRTMQKEQMIQYNPHIHRWELQKNEEKQNYW